jgi:hypothetical protein
MMIVVMILGFMLKLMMILFHRWININPYSLGEGWSIVYLLFCRPVYIIGTSLILLPIVIQNNSTKPLRKFLAHSYWVPQSRLCYGVFLCNSMFMQYRIYDMERGLWVQIFDTNLLYFAIFTYSICFSLITYLFVEGPMAKLISVFYTSKFIWVDQT